jgi:hypothetical protein
MMFRRPDAISLEKAMIQIQIYLQKKLTSFGGFSIGAGDFLAIGRELKHLWHLSAGVCGDARRP